MKRQSSSPLTQTLPAQIVHGDLKTLNILLTRNWAVAKLGDVGVARYLKAKDVPDHVACALLKSLHTRALSSSQCPGCGVCDAESAGELLHMQLDCACCCSSSPAALRSRG